MTCAAASVLDFDYLALYFEQCSNLEGAGDADKIDAAKTFTAVSMIRFSDVFHYQFFGSKGQ